MKTIQRIIYTLLLACIFIPGNAYAHPMPNSVIFLDIKTNGVNAELQLPLNELELAFGNNVNANSNKLVGRLDAQVKSYLLQHIHALSPNGKIWSVTIRHMEVTPVQNSPGGPYKELRVHLTLVPPKGSSTRKFTFKYDVIMHRVITHFALVSIRQDWDNGLGAERPQEIGVIGLDLRSGKILPMQVNIAEGSLWKGFKNMLSLGADHIKEGTDHLLFLLTLLLPAPLLVVNRLWAKNGGTRYSLIRIIKIITAFTIGHSLTLILGATGLIHPPARLVEIFIAISILISAVHALRPIFPGKELFIAGGFGLVHGMAFAETLVNLNLDTGRMALSILGFNIGIELMQLFVIASSMPWLIILSRTTFYPYIRITGAVIAAIASMAWISERISQQSNSISIFVEQTSSYAPWTILMLAMLAVISLFTKYSAPKHS